MLGKQELTSSEPVVPTALSEKSGCAPAKVMLTLALRLFSKVRKPVSVSYGGKSGIALYALPRAVTGSPKPVRVGTYCQKQPVAALELSIFKTWPSHQQGLPLRRFVTITTLSKTNWRSPKTCKALRSQKRIHQLPREIPGRKDMRAQQQEQFGKARP